MPPGGGRPPGSVGMNFGFSPVAGGMADGGVLQHPFLLSPRASGSATLYVEVSGPLNTVPGMEHSAWH